LNQIILIDNQLCLGCGTCTIICPKKILYLDGDVKCHVTDESLCDRCGVCQTNCPVRAIKIT
jgi:ferredoxin